MEEKEEEDLKSGRKRREFKNLKKIRRGFKIKKKKKEI